MTYYLSVTTVNETYYRNKVNYVKAAFMSRVAVRLPPANDQLNVDVSSSNVDVKPI